MNFSIPESAPLIAVFGWTFIGLSIVGGLFAARWLVNHLRIK